MTRRIPTNCRFNFSSFRFIARRSSGGKILPNRRVVCSARRLSCLLLLVHDFGVNDRTFLSFFLSSDIGLVAAGAAGLVPPALACSAPFFVEFGADGLRGFVQLRWRS